VDLTAEIKISENVISLLGALYMESGMRLINVCVCSKKTKCVCVHLCVCSRGIIRSLQNSRVLDEVPSSHGVNS